MVAEAAFLERVIELHPEADGKPVVIGNCQGGWAMMMVAATRPELFGPIIIAGAPLSYWAGVHGQNPMRYTGGLNGGSWLTALTGDLGHGIFDGAAPGPELREHEPLEHALDQAVQPLRQGRHRGPALSRASRNGGAATSSSTPRRCSGSSTTCSSATSWPRPRSSPATASGSTCATSRRRSSASARRATTSRRRSRRWAGSSTSTAASTTSAPTARPSSTASTTRSAISASSSPAAWRRRSTPEFASNIDFIDCLPPGLYEAVLTPAGEATVPAGSVVGDYVVRFEQRTLDDIRALGCNDLEDERKFAAVARLSEINLGLYRTFLQPWVRAATTEQSAQLLRQLSPVAAPVRAVLGPEPADGVGGRRGRAGPRRPAARRRRQSVPGRPASRLAIRSWRHWTAGATGATPWSRRPSTPPTARR